MNERFLCTFLLSSLLASCGGRAQGGSSQLEVEAPIEEVLGGDCSSLLASFQGESTDSVGDLHWIIETEAGWTHSRFPVDGSAPEFSWIAEVCGSTARLKALDGKIREVPLDDLRPGEAP